MTQNRPNGSPVLWSSWSVLSTADLYFPTISFLVRAPFLLVYSVGIVSLPSFSCYSSLDFLLLDYSVAGSQMVVPRPAALALSGNLTIRNENPWASLKKKLAMGPSNFNRHIISNVRTTADIKLSSESVTSLFNTLYCLPCQRPCNHVFVCPSTIEQQLLFPDPCRYRCTHALQMDYSPLPLLSGLLSLLMLVPLLGMPPRFPLLIETLLISLKAS